MIAITALLIALIVLTSLDCITHYYTLRRVIKVEKCVDEFITNNDKYEIVKGREILPSKPKLKLLPGGANELTKQIK